VKILVLGLGNELLGDDGIGVLAARDLCQELDHKADVIESGLHGVALLDLVLGYDRLVIIDAITSNTLPVGTIVEFGTEQLSETFAPSPHYTGLPEMIAIARELQLDFPPEIRIFAVAIEADYAFGKTVSPAVAAALPTLKRWVKNQLHRWIRETGHRRPAPSHVKRCITCTS
jgi:hydrogenase maturation protease